MILILLVMLLVLAYLGVNGKVADSRDQSYSLRSEIHPTPSVEVDSVLGAERTYITERCG